MEKDYAELVSKYASKVAKLEQDARRYQFLKKYVGGMTIQNEPVPEQIQENRERLLDETIAKWLLRIN